MDATTAYQLIQNVARGRLADLRTFLRALVAGEVVPDGTTDGTVAASKPVRVDANKDVTGFRNVTATGAVTAPAVTAGASGTAGTLTAFAATASKGKVTLTTADNTGNTVTNINAAAQAAARTLTVPDPGVTAANFMLNTSGTATCSSNAATLNKHSGVITSEALTTAAGSGQALTITDSACATTDMIFVTRIGGTSTGGTPVIKAVPGNGSFVITIDNKHASAAFDGTFILAFLIVKAVA